MDKRAMLRWTVLLSALAVTVAAAWWPMPERPGPVSPATLGRPGKSSVVPNAPLVDAEALEEEPQSAGGDPFAPRGWQAPPPPPPAASAAPTTVAPVDLTPSGPPELPFRFVGSMTDNSEQVVYLARGEQAYVVRMGEVLESTYRVVAITQSQIEFEHISTGVRQTLPIPAREN